VQFRMAPAISCLIAAAVAVAAAAEPAFGTADAQLDRILRGDVSKDELEIVLAQYNEDMSWSDKYGKLRTVYCKGGAACAPDAVRLDNVGREGHSYLSHIVQNYDNLAKWTVFSQAGEPTVGYKGQNQGGGHMLGGATFSDYLVHPHRAGAEDPDAFFLMTSKVHLPTLHHALRSSYKDAEVQRVPKPSALPARCPASKMPDNSSDAWGPYEDMPWLRSFVSDKCGVEETAVGEAMLVFWDSFVQLPRPQNDVVHYAQGARFAVSRDRIRQRSKDFYERLLSLVNADVDPCLNYLYEWAWYYILGKPQTSPCVMTQDEKAQAWAAKSRMLAGGVSGVSGVSGISGISGAPTPAPTPAPGTTPAPTPSVTKSPTSSPTKPPTPSPTPSATPAPSKAPTSAPTKAPTPAPVNDSNPKPATEAHYVEGTVTMQVEDPEAACKDAALLSAFREAAAGLVGGTSADVEAACSVVARRLRSDSRRLAGSIELAYKIATASEEAAGTLMSKITAMPVATLTELINDALPADHPYTITVTGKSEPTMIVVTLTTTTTIAEVEEPNESHARRPAVLGSAMMAVLAAAWMSAQ